MFKEPQTLLEAASLTEEQARQYLESIRWPEGPVCPHCGDIRCGLLKGKSTRPGVYKCYACRKPFSVTVGTVMHRSHITLKQWVLAFYSICSHKKGVSALQLQRDLGLGSYKSAWHLAHRIREAMKQGPMQSLLKGVVEVDETYVGGMFSLYKPGRGKEHKTPVVVVVERDGRAKAKSVKRTDSKTLKGMVRDAADASATIFTDEHRSYLGLGKHFEGGHHAVCHSAGEYARGEVHVNTAESYFALLERGVIGTFHHVSDKHLDRYCEEFSFRWNHRKVKDGERTSEAVRGFDGKRLEYHNLIGKA